MIITPPPIPLKVEDLTISQRGKNLILKFKFPKKKLDDSELKKVDEMIITINIMDKEKKSKKKTIKKVLKNINLEKSRIKKFIFPAEIPKIYSIEIKYIADGKKSRVEKKTFLTAKLPEPPEILESGFDDEKIYIKIKNSNEFSLYRIYTDEDGKKKLKGELKVDKDEEFKNDYYEYDDTSFEYGRDYKYYVTGVLKISEDYETDFSKEIKISTRDKTAPQKPYGLRYYTIGKKVHLMWERSDEKDLKGYIIYLKKINEKDFQKHNNEPIKENEVELELGDGEFLIYIKSIDYSGNESEPSKTIKVKI